MSVTFDRRTTDPVLIQILEAVTDLRPSVTAVQVDVAALNVKYETLHHELLGNGQEGRIQRLERKMQDVRDKDLKEIRDRDIKELKDENRNLWIAHSALKRRVVGYVGLLVGAVAVLKWVTR